MNKKKIIEKLPHSAMPGWAKTFFLFISIFTLVSLIGYLPGIGFLRYYIDGYSINRRAFFYKTNNILWETPLPVDAGFNKIPNNYDATLSSDGNLIIFSRKFAQDDSRLYISSKEGETWTEPLELRTLNSEYEEKNPALSHDGKLLYFSSNRPGGKGGFDILCSVFDGHKWTEPFFLGGDINSKYDDITPEPTFLDDYFFFSSNRPHGENAEADNFNIYRAARLQIKGITEAAGPPAFGNVRYINELNSPYNEGKLSITPRGNIAYLVSDRPGGKGGFDIYQTHFFQGNFTNPVNLDAPVNTPYDEISPTVMMEGFKIFFPSNRYSRHKNDFHFYESVSRQVISQLDYSILVAFLLLLATIIMIYYLLKIMLLNVDMKTLTKCLLASLLIHLLLLFFSSAWFIGGKLKDAWQEGPEEMTISINNLVRENINVAIREGIAALPKAPSEAPSTRPQYTPSQSQRPVDVPPSPVLKSQAAATPVAIAESINTPEESAPPLNTNSLTPTMPSASSILGSSNIRMEAPKGDKDDAAGSSKGKGHSAPKPPTPAPPIERKTFEIAKIPPSMELSAPEAELTGLTAAPPGETKTRQALAPAMRDKDAKESELADAMPGITANISPARGTRSASDAGMFRLPSRMRMEEMPRQKDSNELPDLGMLTQDRIFMQALALELKKDDEEFMSLKFFKEMLKMRNLMDFRNFVTLSRFVQERNLNPVGDRIYDVVPRLSIPTDSELEVPEDYKP
ncbi:MAG: PD40 domain-containing protein [Victivallales bacterium]|nr:PD40 domain-containing protein [Victivallales bacterium]